MLADPRLRYLGARAAALGAVATTFGVMGHVQAGGSAPNPLTVSEIWLVAAVLSAAFLLRRAGLLRIAALLLGEQLLVHVSLMWLVGMPAPPAPMMPAMPGMSGMAGMPGMAMPATAPSMSAMPSMSMVAAHALAAMIAGLWLWRGECALWSLLGKVGAALSVRWLAPATPFAVLDLRIEAQTLPSWGIRIAQEVPRRGPPVAAVC